MVLDCPEDWTCDWLGENQAIGPLEALSFSIVCMLTEDELRISHSSEAQKAIW